MMKFYILFSLILCCAAITFSNHVHASDSATPPTTETPAPTNPPSGGDGGNNLNSYNALIDWAADVFNGIGAFIEHSPNFIERIFAYLIEFAVYVKFYLMLQTMEFAYGIAQALISNLGIDSLVSDAVSSLPAEQRGIFQAFGALRAITILLEAAVTRFVLNFMGW
ncbi:DUF2523 family protein [Photobacterium aquae]|uniref:DUF2523 family protein n=1 Tax=Photobacterium aquae TaxID=1195763 RepID=UPI00069F3AD8|nr:DUF2523 family protein [Photobacterium aquae]